MTNSTLEKVARAMCAELGINPDDWDEPLDGPRVYRWQLELPTARAALVSLRQVDDETIQAAFSDGEDPGYREDWNTLLDHILTEGGEG